MAVAAYTATQRMTPPRPPSCFISYSWDSPAHREWVRLLATRLRAGGVDAVLDAFHAPLGADLTAFMGRIAACDHVLVVCTPGFRAKALRGAGGVGGVGYEQALITGQIFTGAARPEKFIPLLREGTPTEAVPDYLLARHAADFRDDARFEADFEALLRTLHGVPAQPVPALGPVPPFAAAAAVASTAGRVAWQRLLHEPFDLDSDDPTARGRYEPTWPVGVDGVWTGAVREGVCRLDNRSDPDAVSYGHVQLSWGDGQRPLDLNDARASMAVRVLASHGGPFVAAGLLFRFDRVRRHYLGFVLGCEVSALRLLTPQLHLVRRDAAGFSWTPLGAPRGAPGAVAGLAAGVSSPTRWVTLTVEGQGPRLALSVDGELLATVDAPPGLAGDPGWLALGAGGFEFDDFVIATRA